MRHKQHRADQAHQKADQPAQLQRAPVVRPAGGIAPQLSVQRVKLRPQRGVVGQISFLQLLS